MDQEMENMKREWDKFEKLYKDLAEEHKEYKEKAESEIDDLKDQLWKL